MEKITLKPVTKELLYRTDDPDTHADVLTYTGANAQEKLLGTLYVLGHVTFEEEDLGYVISLVSSLAKREYYSEQSVKAQDPKKAFEHALNKLNEVLEDFFKNKSFSLNLGLAAIAGDQLYISKLGKFKVGLARNGQYVDVLNNLMLFQKSDEDEQQFSNIISGKLQPGDKIFAYYPARTITSREKSVHSAFLKEAQSQFADKIAQLASANENFSCCAIHISIDQIKEIPLESLPSYIPTPAPLLTSTETADIVRDQAPTTSSAPMSPRPVAQEKPRVIAAELSVTKKDTVLGSLSGAASTLKGLNRLPTHKKFRGFIIIAAVVLIPLFAVALIRAGGESGDIKTAYKEATANLMLAQSKIAMNESTEARALIMSALDLMSPIESEKATKLRTELESSLDSIDRVSATKPSPIADLSVNHINMYEKGFRILAFAEKDPSVWYNNAEVLALTDTASSRSTTFTLKDPASAQDATVYEQNLYTLSANHIYKYANALKGETKRSDWGTESQANLISLAIDGNIYGLSDAGSIITYFKGERKNEFKTTIPVDPKSRLFAPENTGIFLISNPTTMRLYALNKADGALTTTFKLDTMGSLKDIAVTKDGNVWLVSEDNKLWLLTAVLP